MKPLPIWILTIPVLLSVSGRNYSQDHPRARTPVVQAIEIYGNKKISSDKILDAFFLKKNQPYAAEALKNDLLALLRLYEKKHYYLAAVDTVETIYSQDSGQVAIHIYLTENKPIRTGTISITGNDLFSASRMIAFMETRSGVVFDPTVFGQDIDYLLSQYEQTGRPFAVITIPEYSLISDGHEPVLNLTLAVDEGPEVIIRSIQFEGNTQTQSRVLGRYFGYTPPSLYDQRRVESGAARLRKLTFMDRVEEPEIVLGRDSLYGLQIRVTEGPSNTIDGIAGYVPKRPGTEERGYFTGMINLSFQNLFGTARRLDFRWQKKNRYSQDFLIAYTEPWVAGWPVHLTVSMQQMVQDTIYVERHYGLDAAYEMNPYWQLTGSIQRKTVDPGGTAIGFIFGIPASAFLTASFGIRYDSRDDRLNPTRGVFYGASAAYSRKSDQSFMENPSGRDTIYIGADMKILSRQTERYATQKVLMDFEGYLPVSRRLVLFTGMHGSVYKTPQAVVPYSEQTRLGGLNTLRGYQQEFFSGTRIGWNNLELRWLTSRQSRIFLFADVGYYYRKIYADAEKTRIRTEDGWPVGYGFGLRFQTRMGLFGLDYGLGRRTSLSTGMVHFGITSRF